MLNAYSQVHRPSASRYHVSLAVDDAEINEAQRLRFKVFSEEMGTRLPKPESGLDSDVYDPYCDHLLVRDRNNGEVVGTYRILTPEAAKTVGGYYSEQEFDLTRFHFMRPHMFRNWVARACTGTIVAARSSHGYGSAWRIT